MKNSKTLRIFIAWRFIQFIVFKFLSILQDYSKNKWNDSWAIFIC